MLWFIFKSSAYFMVWSMFGWVLCVHIGVQCYDLICNVKCRHGVCVLQKPPFLSAAHNNSCSWTVGSGLAFKVMLRFFGQPEVNLMVEFDLIIRWRSGIICKARGYCWFGLFPYRKSNDLRSMVRMCSYYDWVKITFTCENKLCFFPLDVLHCKFGTSKSDSVFFYFLSVLSWAPLASTLDWLSSKYAKMALKDV